MKKAQTTDDVIDVADDASTRQRVLQSILQHGASTAAQLGARLGLTPAAIRRHLTGLEGRGLVASSEQRVYGHRGRGRPSRVFALTDAGRADFHHAYDDLAIQAIQHLATTAGPSALTTLAEQRVADIEQRYLDLRASQPDLEPVEALATALSDGGYVASITPARHGDQLCQHHCPVAHVAAEFPQLCEVETQVFSRLLGTHVQRLATIAHGDGICTTNIPHPTVRKA